MKRISSGRQEIIFTLSKCVLVHFQFRFDVCSMSKQWRLRVSSCEGLNIENNIPISKENTKLEALNKLLQ